MTRSATRGLARLTAGLHAITPARLKRSSLDEIARSIEQHLEQGDKSEAIRLARAMRRQRPTSLVASRLLVRSLLAAPLATAEVTEARAEAESLLRLHEKAAPARRLYVDVLIAQHLCGLKSPDLTTALTRFATSFPVSRHADVARFINYLVAAGDLDLAGGLACSLAELVNSRSYWLLAHRTALRCGHLGYVGRIEQISAVEDWFTPEDETVMAAERALTEKAASDAIRRLKDLRPSRSEHYSRLYVQSLFECGDHAEVLDYLDRTNHGLDLDVAVVHRFNALFSLGRVDEARTVVESAASRGMCDVAVVRALRDAYRQDGDGEDDAVIRAVRRAEAQGDGDTATLNRLICAYFELDLLDDVDRLASAPAGTSRPRAGRRVRGRAGSLRETSIRRGALARRSARRFITDIGEQSGCGRESCSSGATSRSALDRRKAVCRDAGGVDEVAYFALLQLRRYREGFELYCPTQD